jgi:cell pole-organizing protein PopZ
MEEILASIRRIISEDAATEDKPAAAPAPSPDAGGEVIELTQMVREDGSVVDVRAMAESGPAPEPPPEPKIESSDDLQLAPNTAPSVAAEAQPSAPDEGILSPAVADETAAAFTQLAKTVTDTNAMRLGNSERTLEELCKELLRPMLKEWLDANLPQLVQREVEQAISRLVSRSESEAKK